MTAARRSCSIKDARVAISAPIVVGLIAFGIRPVDAITSTTPTTAEGADRESDPDRLAPRDWRP